MVDAAEGRTINDERDVIDLLAGSGESQNFKVHYWQRQARTTRYVLRQHIHGIETDHPIFVLVHNETKQVVRILGKPRSEDELAKQPALSSGQAIEQVTRYLQHGGPRIFDVPFAPDRDYQTDEIYRGDELWWTVGVELSKAPVDSVRWEAYYEWFYVSPEGDVSPMVEGASPSLPPPVVTSG